MIVTTTTTTQSSRGMVDYHRLRPARTSDQPPRKTVSATQASIYIQSPLQPQNHSSPPAQQSPKPQSANPIASHSRSRTSSSSVFPSTTLTHPLPNKQSPPLAAAYSRNTSEPSSRRFSTATTSTTGSVGQNNKMQRQGTTGSSTAVPRRSTSSRSSTIAGSTSYVALMRKQKATVWCDRSQNIDPRIAAAQKAAKRRAILEVHGGTNTAGRNSTITSTSLAGKIRHHGIPKAPGYVPPNLSGAGVPMRLSANEMLGDEDEGRILGDDASPRLYTRTGSGRSSTKSAKYPSGYPRTGGRYNTNGTPPNGVEEGSYNENIPELAETSRLGAKNDYFGAPGGNGGSGSSSVQAEGEDSFGGVMEMKGPSAALTAAEQAKKAEDLRRRGSVDERAMTMKSGVRLFVANPDLD